MTFDRPTPKSNLGFILIPCTFTSNFIKTRLTLLKLWNENRICYDGIRTDGRTVALFPPPTSSARKKQIVMALIISSFFCMSEFVRSLCRTYIFEFEWGDSDAGICKGWTESVGSLFDSCCFHLTFGLCDWLLLSSASI